jgi:hypothetical protein
MATLIYPADFICKVRAVFSSQQTSIAYDILKALDTHDFGLDALLSKYLKTIKLECGIEKCDLESMRAFLSETIQVLNFYDLEALSDEGSDTLTQHKIRLMGLRDAIDRKLAVKTLRKLWIEIYDADQAQHAYRVPKLVFVGDK